MNGQRWLLTLVGLALSALFVAACAPSASPAPSTAEATQPIVETPLATQIVETTTAAAATATPPPAVATAAPEATSQPAGPTPTAAVEARIAELEWPPQMRLGESDVVRLSLFPTIDGFVVTTEFPEHQAITQTVHVSRPGGFELSAVGRLEGVGFVISPQSEQAFSVPVGEAVTWRWSLTPRAPGQQRLALNLVLRWTPVGAAQSVREAQVYSRSLDVRVASFLGLTARQAMMTGMFGLVFGSGLSLMAVVYRVRLPRQVLVALSPNPALALEPHPSINLTAADQTLLQVLFRRYARVVVESEFRSGYSGARTFLALPVRADGRADAHTIVKIGERESIRREFENYETFVKDTLPPITARIQEPPVTTSTAGLAAEGRGGGRKAALRYTFIAEPGRKPVSLRESLISDPNPALLERLFSTFGPNWWMQRRPFTFRLAREYDRMLPAHYVLKPVGETRKERDTNVVVGRTTPASLRLEIGEAVTVRRFPVAEPRADGGGLSLSGEARPGQPPLRIRWLGAASPDGAAARVVATRETLLRDIVAGFGLSGLPDPLARLPELLDENVTGTQSTIHGDLNVENVLVGPGGFVWLIDFAQTREGHPLFDFAHLEAEIIAHVIAPRLASPADGVPILRDALSGGSSSHPLLAALHAIAARCLFNPSHPREHHLALYMACLGALKFSNLEPFQKHVLYLTSALLSQGL